MSTRRLTRRDLARSGLAAAAGASAIGAISADRVIAQSPGDASGRGVGPVEAVLEGLNYLVTAEGHQPTLASVDRVVLIELTDPSTVLTGDFRKGRTPRIMDGSGVSADTTVRSSVISLAGVLLGTIDPGEALSDHRLRVDGDAQPLVELLPLIAAATAPTMRSVLISNVGAAVASLPRGSEGDASHSGHSATDY